MNGCSSGCAKGLEEKDMGRALLVVVTLLKSRGNAVVTRVVVDSWRKSVIVIAVKVGVRG